MARFRVAVAIAALLVALGLASVVFTKLALAAGFLSLLGLLALPGRAPAREQRRVIHLLLALAGVSSTIGIVRFVVREAAPGMVQGGHAATAQHAVSRLRQILFAEDAMRKGAFLDPDQDRIGSAGLLGELTGAVPLRGGARLEPPILSPAHYARFEDTPLGPAALVAGYYFIVCLPAAAGGWTARPGEPIDDELAERRFVAYAWPASGGAGPHAAYFIDEHEKILVSDNLAAGEPRFAGPGFPPPCEAALDQPGDWQPWRGKQPRSQLPGDRP
jgi:hypothetical protein